MSSSALTLIASTAGDVRAARAGPSSGPPGRRALPEEAAPAAEAVAGAAAEAAAERAEVAPLGLHRRDAGREGVGDHHAAFRVLHADPRELLHDHLPPLPIELRLVVVFAHFDRDRVGHVLEAEGDLLQVPLGPG